VEPGKPVWVGLQLTHQPEWHTYWKNSGDSGLPTQLDWQLPAGIDAGEIAWPTPKKIPIGTLANYGYEKTVLLPVPLTVAPGFAGSQLEVKLKAAWLVCRKECIPQEGDFSLSIPVRSSTGTSSQLFKDTFAATPKALPAGPSQVDVGGGKAIRISLAGLPAALQGKTLALYPETGSVIEPAAAWQQAWQGALWTAEVPLVRSAHRKPGQHAAGGGFRERRLPHRRAGERRLARAGGRRRGAARARSGAARQCLSRRHAAANQRGARGPDCRLLGALLGGLVLNLMPCVFPVLAIKVVGFVQVKDQATRLTTGLAYTVGVVLSFLALGALLLGLRAAGEQLGWGFQLQTRPWSR
jgi:DsbC/DsbD-like thiol-disulfide interchange protein